METVNVQEAKTHLSRLLARVEAGETIMLARAGKPIARLEPAEPPSRPDRELGFLAGTVAAEIPDSFFFDPLPEEELAAWGV